MLLTFETPFGSLSLELFEGKVIRARFGEFPDTACDPKSVRNLMSELDEKTSSFPLNPAGTLFQRKVWERVSRIGPGMTATYLNIANELMSPSSARAVASAAGNSLGLTSRRSDRPMTFIARAVAPILPGWVVPTSTTAIFVSMSLAESIGCLLDLNARCKSRETT